MVSMSAGADAQIAYFQGIIASSTNPAIVANAKTGLWYAQKLKDVDKTHSGVKAIRQRQDYLRGIGKTKARIASQEQAIARRERFNRGDRQAYSPPISALKRQAAKAGFEASIGGVKAFQTKKEKPVIVTGRSRLMPVRTMTVTQPLSQAPPKAKEIRQLETTKTKISSGEVFIETKEGIIPTGLGSNIAAEQGVKFGGDGLRISFNIKENKRPPSKIQKISSWWGGINKRASKYTSKVITPKVVGIGSEIGGVSYKAIRYSIPGSVATDFYFKGLDKVSKIPVVKKYGSKIGDYLGLNIPRKIYSKEGIDYGLPTGSVFTPRNKIISFVDKGVIFGHPILPPSMAFNTDIRRNIDKYTAKDYLINIRDKPVTKAVITGATYAFSATRGFGIPGAIKSKFITAEGGTKYLLDNTPKLGASLTRSLYLTGKYAAMGVKAGVIGAGVLSYGVGIAKAPTLRKAITSGSEFKANLSAGFLGGYVGSKYGIKKIQQWDFTKSAVTKGLDIWSRQELGIPPKPGEYYYRFGKDTLTAYARSVEYRALYGDKMSSPDKALFDKTIKTYANYNPTDKMGILRVHAAKDVEFGLRGKYGFNFDSKALDLKDAFPHLSKRGALSGEKFLRSRGLGGSLSRYARYTKTTPPTKPHDPDYLTKLFETKGMAKRAWFEATNWRVADVHYPSEMKGSVWYSRWQKYPLKSGGYYKAPSDKEMFGRNWEGLISTRSTPAVTAFASRLPKKVSLTPFASSVSSSSSFIPFISIPSGYKSSPYSIKSLSPNSVFSSKKSVYPSSYSSLSSVSSSSSSSYPSSYSSPSSVSSSPSSVYGSTSISSIYNYYGGSSVSNYSKSVYPSNYSSISSSSYGFNNFNNVNLIVSPVFPGGGGGRGKKPKRMVKRRTKYLPSLWASGEGIFGKIPKRLTGLEIRPVVRY